MPPERGLSHSRRGDSCLQAWGRKRAVLLTPRQRIGLAITFLDGLARADMDALDRFPRRLEVAETARPDGDAPPIHARLLARSCAMRGRGRAPDRRSCIHRPRSSPWALCLGALSGKPVALVRRIWRLWRPIAVIRSGITWFPFRVAGGLAPTPAASSPCVLGRSRTVRFHVVRPPSPSPPASPRRSAVGRAPNATH